MINTQEPSGKPGQAPRSQCVAYRVEPSHAVILGKAPANASQSNRRAAECRPGLTQAAAPLLANLSARIGSDVAGTFAGVDMRLAAVPLDVLDAAGQWRFAGGRLTLSGAGFRLEDRQVDDRFRPLVAQGAELTLANNVIDPHAPDFDAAEMLDRLERPLNPERWPAAMARVSHSLEGQMQ